MSSAGTGMSRRRHGSAGRDQNGSYGSFASSSSDRRSSYVRLAPEAEIPRAIPAPVLVMSLLAPAILPGLESYRPVTSLAEFMVQMRNRRHWNVPDAVC